MKKKEAERENRKGRYEEEKKVMKNRDRDRDRERNHQIKYQVQVVVVCWHPKTEGRVTIDPIALNAHIISSDPIQVQWTKHHLASIRYL